MGILLAVIGLGWATERVEGAEKLPEGIFFSESFEDADLAGRGWYDGTTFRIVGDAAAGKGCIEYEWPDRQSGVQGSSSSGCRTEAGHHDGSGARDCFSLAA